MKKQKIKKKSKKFLYKNRKRSNQNNYVLSVCVVWKYHWMVKFRLPNSVVFENYTMLLLRHTRLWSMMNALCQINRNVRKKNSFVYIYFELPTYLTIKVVLKSFHLPNDCGVNISVAWHSPPIYGFLWIWIKLWIR